MNVDGPGVQAGRKGVALEFGDCLQNMNLLLF